MMKSGEEADNTYHAILPCSLLYVLAWYFSIPLCNPHPPEYTWFWELSHTGHSLRKLPNKVPY